MSDGPAHESKEEKERAPRGINAALRYAEPAGTSSGSGGTGGDAPEKGARHEGPYVSHGALAQKAEAERPAGPARSGAAALHRAHEAAYDPSGAGASAGDAFVGPSSFGLGVYGGAPLGAAPQRGGDPNKVPSGGHVSWSRGGDRGPGEVGPPPAHPLSVASPLGIGVAGGAWTAPEGGLRGGDVAGLATPAGNLSRGAGQGLQGPAGGASVQGKAAEGAPARLREDAGNLARGAGQSLTSSTGGARPAGGASRGGSPGAAAAIGAAWQGLWS